MDRLLQISRATKTDEPGCLGTVTDVDFGGGSSMLAIQLLGEQTDRRTFLVRCANTQMPTVGATVKMTPTGLAHVLDKRI
jgi:hypothetical protein